MQRKQGIQEVTDVNCVVVYGLLRFARPLALMPCCGESMLAYRVMF
jgi:hypothetical protein